MAPSCSLVTSFSGFWRFRAPIRLIGYLFFRFLEIQGTNTAHWLPLFPVSGDSGHQYGSLVTSFSGYRNFAIANFANIAHLTP